MPAKSKPFQANQRASTPHPPNHPRPSFCQSLCFTICSQRCLEAVAAGSPWPHPYMFHYSPRKVVHHLYIKNPGLGRGWEWDKKEAKQTD